MAITRLFDYLAGSLAKGEDVSAEYDSIIAFANGLEISKLSTTGGTVSNLTVSGAFTTGGANTFNGASAFNADITLATTKKVIFGDAFLLNTAGVGSITLATGVITSPVAPSSGNHVANKTYVDGLTANVAHLTGVEIFTESKSFAITKLITMGVVGSGERIEVYNDRINFEAVESTAHHYQFGDLDTSALGGSKGFNLMTGVLVSGVEQGLHGSPTLMRMTAVGFTDSTLQTKLNLTPAQIMLQDHSTATAPRFLVDITSNTNIDVYLVGLRTSAGATGQLWNNAGVLQISP